MAKGRSKSQSQSGARIGKPVTVQLSPPAYAIRQQAGLGLPTGRQLLESVAGVLAGAAISAVFITALRNTNPLLGALTTGGLGIVLSTTSPIGTIPQELGMGALATSAAWVYFDATGQFSAPNAVGQPAAIAQAPPLALPMSGRRVA